MRVRSILTNFTHFFFCQLEFLNQETSCCKQANLGKTITYFTTSCYKGTLYITYQEKPQVYFVHYLKNRNIHWRIRSDSKAQSNNSHTNLTLLNTFVRFQFSIGNFQEYILEFVDLKIWYNLQFGLMQEHIGNFVTLY